MRSVNTGFTFFCCYFTATYGYLPTPWNEHFFCKLRNFKSKQLRPRNWTTWQKLWERANKVQHTSSGNMRILLTSLVVVGRIYRFYIRQISEDLSKVNFLILIQSCNALTYKCIPFFLPAELADLECARSTVQRWTSVWLYETECSFITWCW